MDGGRPDSLSVKIALPEMDLVNAMASALSLHMYIFPDHDAVKLDVVNLTYKTNAKVTTHANVQILSEPHSF